MTGAEQLGDQEAIVHCLNTIGAAMIVGGRLEEGREHLEKSLLLAERLASDAGVGAALGNLGSGCGEVFRFDLAEDYLARDVQFCIERDLDLWRAYASSWQALVHVYRGRWSEASATAHEVLRSRWSSAIARITALIALGKLRARRGDPGVWEALDEARELAGHTGTLQRVAAVSAARAEAAWLEGRAADVARETETCIELAIRKRHAWFASELSFWRTRGSGSGATALPDFCEDNPFALEAAGRWQEAAARWRALGCAFEAGRALAGGDESAQREALTLFESMGARPMADRVRRRLRAAGVRSLPRGPRQTTRQHPAGLTTREVAVLKLVAEGLRNREIGERLLRSTRTVDHHLVSIFTKLGATTRAEAVSAAFRLGVISSTGERTS